MVELKDLGKHIKMLRKHEGMSQAQLAGLAGVSRAYIHAIEHGKKLPSLPVLRRIAEACNAIIRVVV